MTCGSLTDWAEPGTLSVAVRTVGADRESGLLPRAIAGPSFTSHVIGPRAAKGGAAGLKPSSQDHDGDGGIRVSRKEAPCPAES